MSWENTLEQNYVSGMISSEMEEAQKKNRTEICQNINNNLPVGSEIIDTFPPICLYIFQVFYMSANYFVIWRKRPQILPTHKRKNNSVTLGLGVLF